MIYFGADIDVSVSIRYGLWGMVLAGVVLATMLLR